jgi:hypothetical protein
MTDVPPKPAETLRAKARLKREAARVALLDGDSEAAAELHLKALADEGTADTLERQARVGHE